MRGDRYGGPQVPVHDRRNDPPAPGRDCQYTSEQLARHLESYGTRPSAGRTGVCWAGAWAEVGGCDPEEREGLSDGVSHKKQGHPGYCPLRSSPVHTIRNDSTLPWGTGRPTRSRRSTEQQDKQPERPLSELSETRPAAQSAIGLGRPDGAARTGAVLPVPSRQAAIPLPAPRATCIHGVPRRPATTGRRA